MTTTLEGTVQRIRFANDATFWTVAVLEAEGERRPVTVVGQLPGLQEGMSVRVEGRWEDSPRFGMQLKAERYTELVPATEMGLVGYLASGFIPGVGRKMAERIVEHFGTDAVETIMRTPDKLREVKGLGVKRAEAIVEAFRERRGAQQALVFLFGLGIPRGMAMRIYRRYEDDTVALVRRKPYRLAEDVHGIGFLKADQVAQAMNIPRDHPGRVRAGVYHRLRLARDDGHCFLPREVLIADAAELLGLSRELVGPAIGDLAADGKLVSDRGPTPADDEAVYLRPLYDAERDTARRLAELLGDDAPGEAGDPALAQRIADAAASLGVTLALGQARAVELALARGTVIVTGGPGTGKTTIIRTLLEASGAAESRVALAAPTGRAAKRMAEATDRKAQTIHRLLEYSPNEGGFQRDQLKPLEVDLVIIDEASMVDLPLFHALIRAIPGGAHLVLVGDQDQLPPVGPGAPLTDLIRSGRIPVARLTEIFRQGPGSAIVDSAHALNRGEAPRPTPSGTPLQDFYFIRREAPEQIREAIEHLVTDRIPDRFGLDPVRDIQVLSPMRGGPIGVERLNEELQALLNPPRGVVSEAERRLGFRLGDKVMQVKNDYDAGVFNGDLGFVCSLDASKGLVGVNLDGREILYTREMRDNLVLAYAVTVHKSQGSEYPAVVIPVSTQHFKMLRRNLLYTGITRGKRLVVLVGTERALRIAVG
ncbi:MAG: ATP-dependent RecD-like DNA helicase, partial [Proteobacteria bacterium]